jgi:hypothetical protein
MKRHRKRRASILVAETREFCSKRAMAKLKQISFITALSHEGLIKI